MKKISLLMLILTLFVLQGCGEMSYRAKGTFRDGYSETRLSQNMYRVAFHGAKNTSKERVYDFALLRSAELTLQNGYQYFVILESITDNLYTETKTPVSIETSKTDKSTDSYGKSTPEITKTKVSGGETVIDEKPGLINLIACYEGKPKGEFSYDAEFIYKSISAKYKIKKPELA